MAVMSDSSSSRPGNHPADGPAPGEAGLARWANEYAGDLRRFLAKRRIVESDIKDVCQEVYLRLLRFDRAAVVQNPQAYLFRVAANVAHDFKLRQQRWQPAEPQDLQAREEQPSTQPGPEQLAEQAARARRTAQALATLPPMARAALALQIQEELTYEQIAARLGTSRRSVKRAVARGYALMREALSDVV
jgi:RNA polymerase sigma-70 factor (ECF subfamily)